jgi:peptidyl-prolyl cis-trans isomerase C
MRVVGRVLCALALAAGLLVVRAETRAAESPVVARIGGWTITARELETRIAALPPFQRASFGSTPADVGRRFLDEVIVRDELLSLGADEAHLSVQQPAAYQLERARSAATIRAVRARLGPAAAIPMEDVQRYYDQNRARYDAPDRYQIWRILCKTEEEARSVLDAAKRDPTPATFGTLAREHSLDKATNLRAGNLGFLTADGISTEPGLRVEPGVVRAAQAVGDGELVPSPVAEGEYFSVVWRRGTVAASRRSVNEVAPQIRDALWKGRVKDETDKLVASLRAAKLRDLDESLLATIDLPVDPHVEPAGQARVQSGVSAPSGNPR